MWRVSTISDLRRMDLYTRAAQLLWMQAPGPKSVIDLEQVVADAASTCDLGVISWRLRDRKSLKISAPASHLRAVIDLLAETCASRREEARISETRPLAIRASRKKGWLRLRFLQASTAPGDLASLRAEELRLDLARELTTSVLEGKLESDAKNHYIELSLPVES